MNEHPVPFDWDDFYMRERKQQITVPFAANSGITSVSAKSGELNRPVPAQVEDPSVLSALWVAIKRLPAYVRLAGALARDGGVPAQAKASLAIGSLYVVSPVDLVPGIIPVLGQLDDLYVLLTALQIALRTTPAEIAAPHLERAGVAAADIETDLAAVRQLVRTLAVKTMKVGSKVVVRAGGTVSSLVRKSMHLREGATHEQKSF